MVGTLKFDIQGIDAAVKKQKRLAADARLKGGRFALRKAANLIRDDAKANAEKIDNPQSPENIADNIAIRNASRHTKLTGDPMLRIGVLGGARDPRSTESKWPGGNTFHWRFIEFGTENMRAQPFMRRALSDNVERAVAEFALHFGRATDRALKRAGL